MAKGYNRGAFLPTADGLDLPVGSDFPTGQNDRNGSVKFFI
jgi:hypothetical protein